MPPIYKTEGGQMKASQFLFSILATICLTAYGCSSITSSSNSGGDDSGSGSGGSSGSTTVEITTIEGLPQATSPVVSSSSSGLSAIRSKNLASTGMNLRSTTGYDFDSNSSLAACEMFNQAKNAINQAGEGDLILCYVKQLASDDTSIYDGEYHAFDLGIEEGEEEGGAPDHVKFKVTKSGDLVTGFEMFGCRSGEQVYYLNQTISGTDFSMSAKGEFAQGSFSSAVTGTLNSSGQFVGTKTISMQSSGTFDGNLHYESITAEQTTSTINISGYNVGSFADQENGGNGSYSNAVAAFAQLLDANASGAAVYDIGLLALGEGAVSGLASGSVDFDNPSFSDFEWDDNYQEAWNGDTTAVVEDNDFLDLALAATLPTISASAPTISFTGSEVYDCNTASEGTITGSQEEMDTACAVYDLGHEWINCWDITGQDE